MDAVTSISTCIHVPQPIEEKAHFVQNRIFVGGFSRHTTTKELSRIFNDSYGQVIETNIILSEDGSKCYGFVTFHPKNTNAVAVILDEYQQGKIFYLNGRPLIISKAVFRPKKVKVENKVQQRSGMNNGIPPKVYIHSPMPSSSPPPSTCDSPPPSVKDEKLKNLVTTWIMNPYSLPQQQADFDYMKSVPPTILPDHFMLAPLPQKPLGIPLPPFYMVAQPTSPTLMRYYNAF